MGERDTPPRRVPRPTPRGEADSARLQAGDLCGVRADDQLTPMPNLGDGGAMAVTRPILPSADLDATAAAYAPLGFTVTGKWPDDYLILAGPDDIELHFWHSPKVNRWTNDVACWIGYPTAGAVRVRYDAWRAAGVAAPADLRPPADDGRLLEFQLIDLHGNLVRVGALVEPPPT